MIYFLEIQDTGNIKIGYSRDVVSRAKQWRRELGCLKIVGTLLGDYKKEKEIHNIFNHLSVNGEGSREIFSPCNELIDFIISNTYQTEKTAEFNLLFENGRDFSHLLTHKTLKTLTMKEASKILGIGHLPMSKAIHNEEIKAERLNMGKQGRWSIPPKSIIDYLDEQRKEIDRKEMALYEFLENAP